MFCIIILNLDFIYRGTINFKDILEAGSNKERTEIQNLQNKLQFDEPINIQFTSVSYTTNQDKVGTIITIVPRSLIKYL